MKTLWTRLRKCSYSMITNMNAESLILPSESKPLTRCIVTETSWCVRDQSIYSAFNNVSCANPIIFLDAMKLFYFVFNCIFYHLVILIKEVWFLTSQVKSFLLLDFWTVTVFPYVASFEMAHFQRSFVGNNKFQPWTVQKRGGAPLNGNEFRQQ